MSNHVLLTVEAHGALRINTRRDPALGDAVMSCLIPPDEFRQAQNHYPILFHRPPGGDRFQAVALFGFHPGENLFLEADGWDAAYLPLAMTIQPFLIGAPTSAGAAPSVHIDMASPRILRAPDADGAAVFDEAGRPTAYLETMAEQLGELDAGYWRSADFFSALRRHDLLEPLAVEMMLEDGGFERLVGFHVIVEARLAALDADSIAALHAEGHLQPIYMAIASLANLAALIARKNRRLRHG